jgi:polyisoprenoid-binding protein YceI
VPGADGTVQVAGELTVRGISRPQSFPATVTGSGSDAVTLSAELTVDRGEFGMGWNQLGMLRGLTTVTVALRFTHEAAA